jgi:hypothetical protein
MRSETWSKVSLRAIRAIGWLLAPKSIRPAVVEDKGNFGCAPRSSRNALDPN